MTMDFIEFPKMARLSRECVITEKIDGTNGCIAIEEDGVTMQVGSRTRWITTKDDNYGFAKWAESNRDELLKLGPGRHFGEWWGSGIQRGYGLTGGDKRFSLFNVHRWKDPMARPACCSIVPVIYKGKFSTSVADDLLSSLIICGSLAVPGFMKPEGIVIFHIAAQIGFKKTIEKDEEPKGFRK